MPRPHLSQDPHNQRRMSIMATMHEVIYCLRNTPHRLNDIVDMLNGVLRQLPSAISSSTRERDYEFEICARDLEDMIPRSLSLVQRSSSQEFRGIAENLIGCIPRSLQQPARWDPEVEEAASEAGSVARQHVRREDDYQHSEYSSGGRDDRQTVRHQSRHHHQTSHHHDAYDPHCPVHGQGHRHRR